VLVPKATVNENDSSETGKNNIRLSRQIRPMNPKAKSETVQELSHS